MTDLPEPVRVNGEYEYAYTATQMREYRNATLEEAAKVCETQDDMILQEVIADKIRALKEQK